MAEIGTSTDEVVEIPGDEFGEVGSATKTSKEVSNVWQHMPPLKENGIRVKAFCNYCKKTFSANPGSGTSHLRRHITSCPAKRSIDLRNVFLKSEKNSDGITSIKNHKFDVSEVRVAVTQLIVYAKLLFSFVEHPAFRHMIGLACPAYQSVRRHTCRRDALKLYKEERVMVKQDLAEALSRLCLTSDNWHNEVTKDEYICITVHWIDINWKMQKRIITFKALAPPYDGLSIADEIGLNLCHWNIDKKILSISLDNASYNDRMVNELKGQLRKNDSLICDGTFFQVRCCCHILNIIVQARLKLVDSVVNRIRGAFNHLNRSLSKQHMFFEMATKKFHLLDKKRLRADIPVKWNSTYVMLECALYFKDVLIHWGERNHEFQSFILSEEEWGRVECIHELNLLYLYLEEPKHDPDNEIDILEFWQMTSNRYPTLALVARDLLSIPVSTVTSELAFSLGKKVINPCRSSLTLEIIQAIVCYEDWLRARGLADGTTGVFGNHLEEPLSTVEENDRSEDCLEEC